MSQDDENTTRELRRQMQEGMVGSARLEVRLNSIERQLADKVADIVKAIDRLSENMDQVRNLRAMMDSKIKDHEEFRKREDSLELSLEKARDRLELIEVLQSQIKAAQRTQALLVAMMISIFLTVLAHVFLGLGLPKL